MLTKPIQFAPYLKTVIWGGNKIAPYKGIQTDLQNVGESWEISAVPGHESVVVNDNTLEGKNLTELVEEYGADLCGTEVIEKYGKKFPLLIKIIDANQDLSVQVHPNDTVAQMRHQSPGKTEMWYIIENEKDANIYMGLSKPLDPEEYMRRIGDNTIMDAVGAYKSAPDQFYFVPAGTIHAIGAGNLLAEVQQSSDITYRVYDFDRRDAQGNPRELHTELAKDVIDYRYPNAIEPTAEVFPETKKDAVSSDYFKVDFLKLSDSDEYEVNTQNRSFIILMVTDGTLSLTLADGSKYEYSKGSTVLIPAVIAEVQISGPGKGLLIKC